MKYVDIFVINMLVFSLAGGIFKVIMNNKKDKAKKKANKKNIRTICNVNELESTTMKVEENNK